MAEERGAYDGDEPNLLDLAERAVEQRTATLERQAELNGRSSSRLVIATPINVRPRSSIIGSAWWPAPRRDDLRLRGRVLQRV
jgi:hypothetical protein